MILGIDIGPYITVTDFNVMKAGGVEFCIIKLTQGNSITNKKAADEAKRAKDAGMIVGLYHWCDPIKTPDAYQVDFFLSKAYGLPYDFVAADVEQYWASWLEWPNNITSILSPTRIENNARTILEEMKASQSKPVVIYTRKSFIDDYARGMLTWINQWPIWAARWLYNAGNVATNWQTVRTFYMPQADTSLIWPVNPKSWFWQWSGDRFRCPGADIAIDMNLFLGTLDELKAKLGMTQQPAPALTLEQKVEQMWQDYLERKA